MVIMEILHYICGVAKLLDSLIKNVLACDSSAAVWPPWLYNIAFILTLLNH